MKTILITGIDSGIGRAIAQKFLSEGDFVIGTSLVGNVDFQNENLKVFQIDLLSDESINNCVQEIKNFGKKIDILINNAGVMLDKDETIVIKEKLRKTLEINLIGLIDFTEQILPEISEGGHILNITSVAGSMHKTENGVSRMPNHYPSYKISKYALNMYTKTLALRLKDKMIVSAVHPGLTRTNMGGQDADLTPEESAQNIFNFAITKPETGQFWFKGEKYNW